MAALSQPVDRDTARHIACIGELTALTCQHTVALPDLIIAAAARHGLTVLTRMTSDRGRLGVPARDPFVDLPAVV